MTDDKPYAGMTVRIRDARNAFLTMDTAYDFASIEARVLAWIQQQRATMIDKTKFYIVRTPAFGNGESHTQQAYRGGTEVPFIWRAKQTLDEAREAAMADVLSGAHPTLDVFEVRLAGRVGPPAPQWTPIAQPRKRRTRKGGKRRASRK